MVGGQHTKEAFCHKLFLIEAFFAVAVVVVVVVVVHNYATLSTLCFGWLLLCFLLIKSSSFE